MALTPAQKQKLLKTLKIEKFTEIPATERGGRTSCPILDFIIKLKPGQSTFFSKEFFNTKDISNKLTQARKKLDSSVMSLTYREEQTGFRVYCVSKK